MVSREAGNAGARVVTLGARTRPSQDRSQETFELILRTTGLLLEDQGFEQLSTNLICRKAGLTPPALYRAIAVLEAAGNLVRPARGRVRLLSPRSS